MCAKLRQNKANDAANVNVDALNDNQWLFILLYNNGLVFVLFLRMEALYS